MYIGIDPGLKGAIALYQSGNLRLWDMPTLAVTRGKSTKLRIDLHALAKLIGILAETSPALAVVEDVGGMPGQSAPAAFSFGWACCAPVMALATCGVPYRLVQPQVWKRSYSIRGDKDDALQLATQLLPAHCDLWSARRGNGDAGQRAGRAEAALIARYASTL